MKKMIALAVVMLSTAFAAPVATVAQEGPVSAKPGEAAALEVPSPAAQPAVPAQQEAVAPAASDATVRELYITAYLAAKRAAREVDPEASLRALQEGVESVAAYIQQELTKVQQESRLGAMEAPMVPPIANPPGRTEPGGADALLIPETGQGTVPSPASPLAVDSPTTLGADVPQPDPVGTQLTRLTDRVERLERIVELLQSATPPTPQP